MRYLIAQFYFLLPLSVVTWSTFAQFEQIEGMNGVQYRWLIGGIFILLTAVLFAACWIYLNRYDAPSLPPSNFSASKTIFATAFQRSPIPQMITWAETNEIVDANEAWCTLIGQLRQEVVGQTIEQVGVFAADERQDLTAVLHGKATGRAVEATLLTKNKDALPITLSAEPLQYEGKTAVLSTYILSNRPTQEGKESTIESFLLEETGRLAKLGGWEFDVETGEGSWTDEVARIHDVDPEMATNVDFGLGFYHGVHLKAIEQALSNCIEHGEAYDLELEIVTATGNPKWIRTVGQPIVKNGRTVKVRGFFQDISERKRAQGALQEQEYFISTILSAAPMIVYVFDMELQTNVYANVGLERVLGFTAEELEAMGEALFPQLMHPDDLPAVMAFQEKVLAANDGEALDIEYRMMHKDGSYRTLQSFELPFLRKKDGALKQKLGIAIDISKRTELEKANELLAAQFYQSQKMESLGRLAGGVAHDFNNILVPIIGYAELSMMKTDPDDLLQANLQKIYQAAERAARLTQQILAFSRKQVLEMQVLDLNDIVAEFETMIERLIGEDIDLQLFLEPELYHITGDKSQIEQVLLNLIINARDAMPAGGKMTIETANAYLDDAYIKKHAETLDPGHYAMLAVSDTGDGMDAETQNRIFEPFFTTKEEGKNTGLGLATVFGIVKQHQGNIWIYSEKGNGATFKIYLPQTDESLSEVDDEALSPAMLYGSETILVVEDEELVRKVISETLEAYGYKVFEAPNPEDALTLVSQLDESIDLLLTDVIMPKLNGRQLFLELSTQMDGLEVLYVSGYTGNVIVHHGILDAGVNFLQKPFTVRRLTEKVRQVLGLSGEQKVI